MSFVTMSDFLAADVNGALSGRKRRSFDPGEAEEPGEGGQSPPPAQQQWAEQPQQQWAPPSQPAPVQQPAPAQQAPWWGGGASFFFPTSPTAATPSAYAQPAYAQPAYANASEEMSDALGAVVEYIRPATTVKEGSFESSAALEAGGDDMSDDDGMGGEQMLYEGLTGGEADKVSSPSLADSVDAGGQGPFVDVATMSTGNWEADDGTGSDVLVEPGQAAPEPAPRVDRASSYRTEDIAAPQPPVFRPASNGAPQNGAARNGTGRNGVARNGAAQNEVARGQNAASRNGTGVVPRNRIAAFENGAPLIQGTGAATAARPRGFSTTQPPNPAAFGLGQTPAPQPSSGVDITKQIVSTAGQIGTAVALSRTPPQYRPGAGSGMDPAAYGQPPAPQGSSMMPWVFGAIGVIGVGVGIWWLTRPKQEVVQVVAVPLEPPMAANAPRRRKSKAKTKSKKAKRR